MDEASDEPDRDNDGSPEEPTSRAKCTWIAHTNGWANKWASGVGMVLTSLDAMELEYALRFEF